MPTIPGKIIGLGRNHWTDIGNGQLRATKHGAAIKYINNETGQIFHERFNMGAIVQRLQNTITWAANDVFHLVDDFVDV